MWSISLNRPFGSLSARRITLFASALLMALFVTITTSTALVQAQTTTDTNAMATWSGENLKYATVTLEKRNRPSADNPDYPNLSGTVCENSDNLYYSGISESPSTPDVYWLYVICINPGSDASDKTQPIKATMLNYSLPKDSKDIRGGAFNRVSSLPIQIAAEGTDDLGNPVDGTKPVSTCSGAGTIGVGWIVCPLTRWIAAGMDAMFGIIKSFMTVAPLSTNMDSPLYLMWNIIRNFANILFIIGFLIIIYSQITSVGISNYGLKRLLPRLIIAAILVNVSYWISAIAVDLSNIFGSYLYHLLTGIGESFQGSTNTDVKMEDITWQAVAGVVLSGGAATAGVLGLATGVVASAGASLWLLLISLMGVLVSALVAILILAARQALITIFIIIAPLAFVAYLLPSTEKYFDRWRFFFLTMLVLYPIFSIIFGGAQLAGMVIIYGAIDSLKTYPNNPNFFNVIILGLIVQVAPVLITPMLIKFGGSLLGRIAGIVNDPNKGLIDRTRKYAQGRQDMTKNRRLWELDQNGKLRNIDPLSRGGRRMALKDINNSHKLKAWESGGVAAYENDARAHEVLRQSRLNEMKKSIGEDKGKAHFDESLARDVELREIYFRQRANRDEADAASKEVGIIYEGLKANPAVVAINAMERQIGREAKHTDEQIRMMAFRENAAKLVQDSNLNEMLASNEDMQKFAGYDGVDRYGATRVASLAQEKEGNAYNTRVTAFLNTQKKVEATTKDRMDIAIGVTPTSPFSAQIKHFADDVEGRAAAVRYIGSDSPVKDSHFLLRSLNLTKTATGEEAVLRSETAGATKRTVFVSSSNRAKIAEGTLDASLRGDVLWDYLRKDTLDAGAFSVSGMASSIDRDDLHEAAEYIKKEKSFGRAIETRTRDQLERDLIEATTNPDYAGSIDKRRKELREIWDALDITAPMPDKLK